MSSGSAKEFEEFAQDCVRLAEQADTPELREKLLNLAREWMRAVMTTSPGPTPAVPRGAWGTMMAEAHQPRRNDVLESMQAMSLLTIMEIVGPVLLLAVLIYGTLQWSRRRRGPTQAVREASTRELYRGARAEKREEAGKAPADENPASRPLRVR